MSIALRLVLLGEAFAVVTFAVGWWGVPVVAFVWALAVAPGVRFIRFASICAAAAWCSLLLLDAARGPLRVVANRFSGVIGLSPFVLFVATLLFPALLTWTASSLGAWIRGRFGARSEHATRARQSPLPSASEPAIADV